MKKTIHLFLVIIFSCTQIFAQELINQYSYNPLDAIQNHKKTEKEIIFYFYNYQSSDLDLRHFKVFHPKLQDKVPNRLNIIPPIIFDSFSSRVYAVTFINKCENCKKGTLLPILIGEYNTTSPAYYIDSNMDGNFDNDGLPFVFTNNKKSQKFKLESDDGRKYIFWLFNSNYHQKVEDKELIKKTQRDYREIAEINNTNTQNLDVLPASHDFSNDGLNLKIGFFAGSGSLAYEYTNADTNYPTTYDVSFDSKGVEFGLGYTWKNIQLSITSTYEGIYYWTSKRRIQYDDPKEIEGVVYSGINTEISTDSHPENRLSYGVSLAYNFRLGNYVAVAPYVNYSRFSYPSSDNIYRPYKRGAVITSKLEDRNWTAFGLSLKGNFGLHSEVYVFGNHTILNFNPASYFENIGIRDLEVKYNQLNFGIGYRYHF